MISLPQEKNNLLSRTETLRGSTHTGRIRTSYIYFSRIRIYHRYMDIFRARTALAEYFLERKKNCIISISIHCHWRKSIPYYTGSLSQYNSTFMPYHWNHLTYLSAQSVDSMDHRSSRCSRSFESDLPSRSPYIFSLSYTHMTLSRSICVWETDTMKI